MKSEILSSSFIGDDERAYAEYGSMADKMALQRRISSSGDDLEDPQTVKSLLRKKAEQDAVNLDNIKQILKKRDEAAAAKQSTDQAK